MNVQNARRLAVVAAAFAIAALAGCASRPVNERITQVIQSLATAPIS